jgi:quinol monooxygenase YgiN
MTIGVIATIRIQDGKAPEFEALFTDLARQVHAAEPGTLVYELTRSRTEANTYKVLEIYKDNDAFVEHGRTDHLKAAGAKLGAVLGGPPELEYLDGVG